MEAQKQVVEAEAPILRLVDDVAEDFASEARERVNVFEQCIQNGQVTVTTEGQASEIARLINRAESDLEAAKLIAAGIVARAQRRLENLEAIFMTPLGIWTSARLAGQKKRSMILPGGQLALRKVPASVKTVEPDTLIAWAKANLPSAIEMVPKVKSDVVRVWEVETGKVAPGRVETPESESFKVSLPKNI